MESESARRASIDWAHLVFLIIIGGITLWYLSDAISVSISPDNLLLVGPLSILALILCVVLGFLCFRPQKTVVKHKESTIKEIGASELRSSDWRQLSKIAGVAVALGCYVNLLNVIGFDIATWAFALVVMMLCGERRPLQLIVFPLLVAGILIAGFHALLPFPMYTMIL